MKTKRHDGKETHTNGQKSLKEIRDNRMRLYRFLNAVGSTAKMRRLGRRIERLETAIEVNDGRADELKEALRATIRRLWAKV
jgi:hypothetical protein